MDEISEYVRYLPAVLWSRQSGRDQLLGRMLRIFERILTSDDPDVPLSFAGRHYRPLEHTIDELHQLFEPWRAPVEHLPWLASWLGVDLPAGWSEHQWRRLIAEASALTGGLKGGLVRALEIYADTPYRPRIAVDDGEVVLRGRLVEDGTARLAPLAFSTVPLEAAAQPMALIYPVAIAVDQFNHYLVADQGTPPEFSTYIPAIWQLSSTGELCYPRSPDDYPLLRPLYAGDPLHRPVALAVDGANRCYVLDAGRSPAPESRNAVIFRLDPDQGAYKLTPLIRAKPAAAWAVCPVDMVLDAEDRFVILDRGVPIIGDIPAAAADQQLVIVAGNPAKVVKTIPLSGSVIEPTALCRWGDHAVIVADAGDQYAGREKPAALVRVDLDSGEVTALLAALPPQRNPLVFPTGLVVERPDSLIVCDTGVRWGFTDESDEGQRVVAEPAALYRVAGLGLSDQQPVIDRITRQHQLVTPKKIALDHAEQLVIVDAGEALYRSPSRNWRADPHTIGVIVLFSGERPATPQQRAQAPREIAALVSSLQPAQTRVYIDTYNRLES